MTTLVQSYVVPKFEIQVEHKRKIVLSLYNQLPVVGETMTHNETRRARHSNNSIDSGGNVGVNLNLSENEGGYLSDVSNSESPPPDLVTHYRRRSKLPETNPVNGSVSDTDDDNIRFKRKPPRGKSSRRRSRQTTEDETKIECYNGAHKRFSWTDSGVSSSMGTGPHSKKLSCGSITVTQIEKSKSTEDVSGIRNIVHDAFNAVSELKDLQRSFKRTHSEHKLCKFFTDSDKCYPESDKCFHASILHTPTSFNREKTPSDAKMKIMESQDGTDATDTSICKNAASMETSSYDNFSLEDIISNLQILNNDKEKHLVEEELEDPPLATRISLTNDTLVTQKDSSNDCLGFKASSLKKNIDAEDGKKPEVFHKDPPEGPDNYTKYTDIVSQPALGVPTPPNIATESRSSKSKAFFSGLRKVASHLKPSSLRSGTTPTLLSKDVSSEFSYAKRKNDEDTIKQLHTITSKFREEITHIQNISISSLTVDDNELNKVTKDDGPATTSSNDAEIMLDRLAVKQSAPSFMDKVFSRRRSYNAMAVNERKEKEKKRASFCDNVFISPCNSNPYSPVSDSYKLIRRRETTMRSGSGIGSCSFSSMSSLTFNEDDEMDARNTSFQSCGGENAERQQLAQPSSLPSVPARLPPPPQQQQQHLQPQQPQQPQPQIKISFHGSDKTLPDDCVSVTQSSSYQSLRGHYTPSPAPCQYSSSLHVHTGSGIEGQTHQHDCPQCAYADYLNYVQFLHLRETGFMWPHQAAYGGNYYGHSNVPYRSNGFNYYRDHYHQCSESSSYPTDENDCSRNDMEVANDELCEANSEVAPQGHDYSCCYRDEEIADSKFGTYV